MNQLIKIDNTEIRQDGQGRYCLNDLHRASGGNPIHAPAQFFRTKSALDFVQALTDMQICTSPIKTIKGGIEQGTYACRELVFKYAAWINAEFEVKVYQVFNAYTKGELQPTHQIPQTLPEALRLAADLAEQNQTLALENKELKPKAAFVDHYVEVGTSKSLREVAKILKMPEKAMIDRLISDRLLYRQSGKLLPFATEKVKPLFTVKTGTAEHGHNYTQTRVTAEGMRFIAEQYATELML
ncbi:phage antirepressor KilAC domain-containing protein [Gallibacterium genomosp. 1]|uniref:phage antirepressor KilAC domain-containing protein n=1 Tax=Gallibacterium genomosp. 1 TaxID=155515 RepID=UPI000802708D|nr:phage antirepressor KilAC domain-containing protein [Gallibacterium genomosp. 1]OBX02222.1 kilA [Gallibacterium genomosp. 1]